LNLTKCDKFNYAKESTQSVKAQQVTYNFDLDTLIWEGSYGRVYYDVHKSEQGVATKNLDANIQADEELLAQVCT